MKKVPRAAKKVARKVGPKNMVGKKAKKSAKKSPKKAPKKAKAKKTKAKTAKRRPVRRIGLLVVAALLLPCHGSVLSPLPLLPNSVTLGLTVRFLMPGTIGSSCGFIKTDGRQESARPLRIVQMVL